MRSDVCSRPSRERVSCVHVCMCVCVACRRVAVREKCALTRRGAFVAGVAFRSTEFRFRVKYIHGSARRFRRGGRGAHR